MAVQEAAEPRTPRADAHETRGVLSGIGVTAGAAVVAGVLLVTREQAVPTLGLLAIIVGALALLATAAAVREWRWSWAKPWTGPNGALEPLAGPIAWLAVVFAAVVAISNFVPEIVPAWSEDQVFAVAIVAFVLLSVLGWGPGVSVGWPSALRVTTLTVLGGLVALVLVAAYLIFLVLLRADATSPGIDPTEWARLVEIRSTLEALAFAAAGALLGATVQRQAAGGELRTRDELIGEKDDELAEKHAEMAKKSDQLELLRSSATAAVRLLTPDAPQDLEGLEPEQISAFGARAGLPAVRQARRTLLEALKASAG